MLLLKAHNNTHLCKTDSRLLPQYVVQALRSSHTAAAIDPVLTANDCHCKLGVGIRTACMLVKTSVVMLAGSIYHDCQKSRVLTCAKA